MIKNNCISYRYAVIVSSKSGKKGNNNNFRCIKMLNLGVKLNFFFIILGSKNYRIIEHTIIGRQILETKEQSCYSSKTSFDCAPPRCINSWIISTSCTLILPFDGWDFFQNIHWGPPPWSPHGILDSTRKCVHFCLWERPPYQYQVFVGFVAAIKRRKRYP